jgi:hypothetical protein
MSFAGPRKMLLERCLLQEMDEAMRGEMSKPIPAEEYKTEYVASISFPNFTPSMDNIQKDSEVLFFLEETVVCI